MFRSRKELESLYGKPSFKERVLKLYSVRELYRTGLRAKDFKPRSELLAAIEFTECGRQQIDRVVKHLNCSLEDAKFSVFLLLFHHDLFVDVDNSKVARILECLAEDILQGGIRYPWLFDHILYDRAYENFAQKPTELTREQTDLLMSGSPEGVFQIGNFLVGPFGVLESEETRWFPPQMRIPLYHCADRMCGELHVAELSQPDQSHQQAFSTLRARLEQELGPASEWPRWIRGLFSDHYWYNDFALANLAWLLGNGFSEKELSNVCQEVIDTGKQSVRAKFERRFGKLFAASGAKIASQLSKPQSLQVILLKSDQMITSIVDRLVDDRTIKIPPTEIRRMVVCNPVPSWAGVYPECSDLGVRVVGKSGASNPLARLRRLILEIHKSDEAKAQLRWSLRHIPGSTIGAQLDVLLARESPASLLQSMVISNISMLRGALAHMQADYLPWPSSDVEEGRFVQKMLWKLGFDKVGFDSPLTAFWDRLKHFEEVASSQKESDGSWIAAVRSAGVNLFVALEELLSKTLAFMCWVFLSDPLADNHIYNSRKGRALLPGELDGLVETEKGAVSFDVGGKNTMFPLIVGFEALARQVRQVVAQRDKYQKPCLFWAHYSAESSLQLFPYKHYKFVCDTTPSDVDGLVALCEGTTLTLQHSKVFEIRNKLEHNNEELPSSEEMRKCCQLLSDAIRILDESGMIPCLYAQKGRNADGFGREWISSQNGSGREVKWQPSPALAAIRSLPLPHQPQIIVPGFKIAETNEPLRFGAEEDSEYTRMWAEYPKHGSQTNQGKAPEATTVEQVTSEAAGSLRSEADLMASTEG